MSHDLLLGLALLGITVGAVGTTLASRLAPELVRVGVLALSLLGGLGLVAGAP